MSLQRLRYFVAVADELHFGRAATRLHMAQPPLSRQIRVLETELGVELFERDTRNVSLTPAGRLLHPEAVRLLRSAERVDEMAAAIRAGDVGVVRLGFVDSAAYELVPRFVRVFRRRWPRVQLELRHLSSDEQLAAIENGELDLGIARTTGDPRSVRSRVVAHEQLYVAVARRARFRSADEVALADLADETIVGFDHLRSPSAHAELTTIFAAQGVDYRPAIEATEYSTILGLVAAGEGVAVVPGGVRTFRAPGLSYVRISDAAARMRLAVLASAAEADPRATDRFEATADDLTKLMSAGRGR